MDNKRWIKHSIFILLTMLLFEQKTKSSEISLRCVQADVEEYQGRETLRIGAVVFQFGDSSW